MRLPRIWPWQSPAAAAALEEMANRADDAGDCGHQPLIDRLERENELLRQDLAAAEQDHRPTVATEDTTGYTGRIRDLEAETSGLQAEIRALCARPVRHRDARRPGFATTNHQEG